MNGKKMLIVAVLFAAAITLVYRQVWAPSASNSVGDPSKRHVTFEYNGPLKGAFEKVTAQSGVKYRVAPEIADRPLQITVKDRTVVQAQEAIAESAKVRYHPRDASSEIPVTGK